MSQIDHPGLEINQNLEFQEQSWRVQRITWALLFLLVVLALLGLFGTGWLSSATAGGEETGLLLDYERFVRHGGEASLDIEISTDQVSNGQAELWLSTDYLADVRVQRISPQPDEVRSEGDRQVYVFLVDDPAGAIPVSFEFQPDIFGRLSGEVGVVDGQSVSFDQFSYP